jgi:PAS domain S-box-containing protein
MPAPVSEKGEAGEIAVLRARLAETEAVLEAIRSGAVDAFMGETGGGFHLDGSEKPYLTFFDEMNEGGVTLDRSGRILHCNSRFADMIGRSIETLRGESFPTCVIPEKRGCVVDLLANQTAMACEVSLESPGEALAVRLSLKSVGTGLQAFSCLVVTDLSERAKAEAELREAFARLQEADALLRQRERDLCSILDNVPSLIGYWDKHLRNRFGNHAYKSWFGVDHSQMSGKHVREVIGEEHYQLNRPRMEAALRGEYQTFSFVIALPDDGGNRHSLAHYIPDVVEGDVQGFYVLVTDMTAAQEAEAAIRHSEERLRAMYANQQSMIEAERKHVAREVHDELGQVLTALRMETTLLQRELIGQEKTQARLKEMRLLTEGMFKTVRSIAGSLRPSTLDLGLVSAIEWLAGDFEKRWLIECALDIDPRDIEASDTYATTVFRVIQESLTNVARHANASRVSIYLRQSTNRLRLEIRDNGCGFTYDKRRMNGFGLVGMQERVMELGGVLTVESSPGHGSGFYIDLPWAPAEKK